MPIFLTLHAYLRPCACWGRKVVAGLEAPIVWKLLAPHSALRTQARCTRTMQGH